MGESLMTRYTIAKEREAAFAEIAALQKEYDQTWAALKPTAKTCEHCGQTHYPNDSPEFAAFGAAARALDTAIFSAVLDGKIPKAQAAAKYGKSYDQLGNGIELVRLTRERERREESIPLPESSPAGVQGTTGEDRGVAGTGETATA